jgi:two-component sensor histidine kinase
MSAGDAEGMANGTLKEASSAPASGQPTVATALTDKAFLDCLLAQSGDCIKILDLNGRLLFMSEGGRHAMAVDDFANLQFCDWSRLWEGEFTKQAKASITTACTGQPSHFTGLARTMRGDPRWWHVKVVPILDDKAKPERILVISRDITEQINAAERQSALIELGDALSGLAAPSEIIAATSTILGKALHASRAAYAVIGLAGTLAIGRNWTDDALPDVQGILRQEDFGDAFDRLATGQVLSAFDIELSPKVVATIGEDASRSIRALIAVPVVLHRSLRGAFLVHDKAPRSWGETEIEFARGVVDRCAAALARAEAEEHQRFLNAELGHRMKNILAMAQAIALQTMRVSTDVATAAEALSGRLSALGKAHDILLGSGHSGGSVQSIIEGALRMHDDRRPDRFHLNGEHVAVGHRAGLPFALMIHELATNAAKFGALSTTDGAVDISWLVSEKDGEPCLVLTWSERGGPQVDAPSRRGFGTRLIERGMSGQVGGVATLTYPPTGLMCNVSVTLAGLQAKD